MANCIIANSKMTKALQGPITTNSFMQKKAEPTKQTEDSMAPLVYSQLQDQLPELYDRIIGFQLLQSENDGKKNLAMAAFNLNNNHYYMPIFFINGFLKPLIILFDLKRKMFKPATEKLVRQLLKPTKSMNISAVAMDKDHALVANPNLYNFKASPLITKMGADHQIFKIVKKEIDKVIVKTAKEIINNTNKKSFSKILFNSPKHTKVAFVKILKTREDLVEKIELSYPGLLNKLAVDIESKENKEKELDIIIKTKPSNANTVEENKVIYNDDVVVIDKRKETAIIVDDISNNSLSSFAGAFGGINTNGIYEVLNSSGNLEEKLCLVNPITINGQVEASRTYIIDLQTKDCCSVPPMEVLAKKLDRHWNNVWPKTIPVLDAEKGKTYILLTGDAEYRQNGCFNGPFCVCRNMVGPDNIHTIDVCTPCCANDYKIIVNYRGRNGLDPIKEDRELVVTQDARLLPVIYPSIFRLGSISQLVRNMFNKGIIKIDTKKVGTEYLVTNDDGIVEHRGSKKEALIHLITNKNLSKKDAEFMLMKTGSFLLMDPYRVKYATSVAPHEQPYYEIDYERLPSNMETPPFSDDVYEKTRLARPQSNSNMVLPTNSNYDMLSSDIDVAMQAASTGEEDIFDTMLIGILGKGQNSSERIKETVPVLNNAAHRVGVQLFTMWWKPNDYSDDFTTDEMYELEQSMLTLFKELGDTALILSLRKKIYSEL